jgi:hypothetical protein
MARRRVRRNNNAMLVRSVSMSSDKINNMISKVSRNGNVLFKVSKVNKSGKLHGLER